MATKEQHAAIAEMMGQHIISYKSSGLSLLEYCRVNGLSVHRFNYWYYQRKKRRPSTKGKGFSRVKPLDEPVSAPASPSPYPTVEVTLANGTRVAFFEPNAVDLFKALL